MKRKKEPTLLQRVFAGTVMVIFLVGFTVSTTAYALIPARTQEKHLTCNPDETATEPIPAFVGRLT